MRKIYLLLLALVSMSNVSAAVKDTFSIGDLTFTVLTEDGNSGTVSVKATSTEITGKVIIPESVSNNGIVYTVTEIADQAFWKCSAMTSVKIPESITYVGSLGFKECTSLDSLVFPNDDMKFSYWYVCQGCTNLTYVRLPEHLTGLGYFMFAECENLESIRIPESCVSFPDYTFFRCYKLKEVNIPYGVPSLGMADFYECYELEHLDIPPTVKSIGKQTFTRCKKLRTLELPNSVERFGWYTFEECTLFKHLTLPSHMKDLGDGGCLEMCSGISEVTIPAEIEDFPYGLGTLPNLKAIYIMGDFIPSGLKNYSRKRYVTIYVKQSVFEEKYSSGAWEGYRVAYKIPVAMTHQYQTLCRDFDMDFSDETVTNGCKVYLASGINASHTNVSVTPITYVPSRERANEEGYTGQDTYNGVIIEGKPYTTYYYKIGERDYSQGENQEKLSEDQTNLLQGAHQEQWVETEEEDEGSNPVLTYGMYDDKFRRYVSDGYINYNRAYLRIPVSASGNAKEFGFDGLEGDGTATSIDGSSLPLPKQSYYDLNGKVVKNPHKGIFISKGRKYIFR